jgi:hypothetical protein
MTFSVFQVKDISPKQYQDKDILPVYVKEVKLFQQKDISPVPRRRHFFFPGKDIPPPPPPPSSMKRTFSLFKVKIFALFERKNIPRASG